MFIVCGREERWRWLTLNTGVVQKEAGAVVAEGPDAAGLVGRLDLREDGGTPYQEQEVEGDQETEPHGRGPDAPVELHRATEAGEWRRHPLHPLLLPPTIWTLLRLRS